MLLFRDLRQIKKKGKEYEEYEELLSKQKSIIYDIINVEADISVLNMISQENENKENNKVRKQIGASYADIVRTQNKLSKIGQDRANNAITIEPHISKTPNTRTGFRKVTKDNVEHKAKDGELNNSAEPENEDLSLDIHRKGHTQLPKTSKNPNQRNISKQYNKKIPGKYIVKGTADVTDREFGGAERRAWLFIGRVNTSATE
ncbi:hypothetical protein HHI36_017192 [Cryptolaemus montrouzieri]|uniref:Uncharacterized protein n=1 Tax=Cryptolaemus montrouzieri TaxID=559131 RepID=A0ABD2NMU1_9CUCU